MKITAIRSQQKSTTRYSVFIDGAFAFSLSESGLLSSGLRPGQELDDMQARELKLLASHDKVYGQASRYAALRPRTQWEVSQYLERKQASPPLIKELLNKLSNIGILDDEKYATSYVHDRRLLRPTSQRKISFELRKKHVPSEIIERVLADNTEGDQTALQHLITRKRQQRRYQDDLKLMQYLARQGFHYSDIKEAIQRSEPTP